MTIFEPEMKSGFHILIVDDEKDFLDSMEFWFRSHGFSVETAESGSLALQAIGRKTPDIIFLDFSMPQMDGIETLKQIRKIMPEVPVLMLTAYPCEEARVEAYKAGVNGFFDKTLDFSQAKDLINSLLRVMTRKKNG